MASVDLRDRQRVLLAAGTVGGAGTTVALQSALQALSGADIQLEITVPLALVDEARQWAPRASVRPVGRVMALVREFVGGGGADVYIGFADRLPLLRRAGRAQVLVVQNPHLYERTDVSDSSTARAKFAALRLWARHSVRRADRVVCSTSASADAVSVACGVVRSAIEVRPIPPPRVASPKVEHRDRIERVLLVGDVYPYKRWEVALDAVAAFAAIDGRSIMVEHLGVVRDAASAERFGEAVERAAAVGVAVDRRGSVDRDEVFAAMRDADVLMLTSEAESQGLPMSEALAMGLPVIARDLPVFSEQAADVAALVSGGIEDFAAALALLDDRDERVRRSLARTAPVEPGPAKDARTTGWQLLD